MMMIGYNKRPKTGVPHVVTDEEHYGGWVFPQGSMIISNIWYIPVSKIQQTVQNSDPPLIVFRTQGNDERRN